MMDAYLGGTGTLARIGTALNYLIAILWLIGFYQLLFGHSMPPSLIGVVEIIFRLPVVIALLTFIDQYFLQDDDAERLARIVVSSLWCVLWALSAAFSLVFVRAVNAGALEGGHQDGVVLGGVFDILPLMSIVSLLYHAFLLWLTTRGNTPWKRASAKNPD